MATRRSFIRQAGTITAAASMFPFLDILQTEDVNAAVKNIEHLSPLERIHSHIWIIKFLICIAIISEQVYISGCVRPSDLECCG